MNKKKSRKHLIIVDMQKDFLTGTLPNKGAVAAITEVRKLFDEADTVVFTRDTHQKDYLNTLEGKNLPVTHCVEGTDGWEICDELKDLVGKKPGTVVNKVTFGYLKWKELYEALGIEIGPEDEIWICGTVNPICPAAQAVITRATWPDNIIKMFFPACGFMDLGDGVDYVAATKAVLKMQQIEVVE